MQPKSGLFKVPSPSEIDPYLAVGGVPSGPCGARLASPSAARRRALASLAGRAVGTEKRGARLAVHAAARRSGLALRARAPLARPLPNG
jgi:hypothetical protein